MDLNFTHSVLWLAMLLREAQMQTQLTEQIPWLSFSKDKQVTL